MQAYHIAVDSKHNVWGNLWTWTAIVRSIRAANAVTVSTCRARHRNPAHRAPRAWRRDLGGDAGYRTSQMGVLTLRSEADLRGAQGESA